MKRIIALALAVLMIAAIFVGCGGSSTQQGQQPAAGGDKNVAASLKVWAPSLAVELTKTLCADFNKEYPNVQIEVVAQEEGDAATQLLNDPDTAADVFSFPCDQLNKLKAADVVLPVSPAYLEEINKRDSKESIETGTIDGVLLAFPETCDNSYCLYYDKSVVSDADAATWEGVIAACKKAGKQFVMDAGNGFYSCMFPFTGGLKITGITKTAEGDDLQQFNEYDEKEVIATLQAFNDLFIANKETFLSQGVDKIASGMKENPTTVGAGIDGTWDASAIKAALGDNYAAAKLPTIKVNGTDKQTYSIMGSKLIGVNAKTKAPEVAQALAFFLTNEACQTKRAQELSWGPSNINAAASDAVASDLAVKAVLEQAKFSVPQVFAVSTFWDPMATLGNSLWKEKQDAASLKTLLDKTIANIKDQ